LVLCASNPSYFTSADRVALLILLAFATCLLTFAQVLRSRRKPVDE